MFVTLAILREKSMGLKLKTLACALFVNQAVILLCVKRASSSIALFALAIKKLKGAVAISRTTSRSLMLNVLGASMRQAMII